MSPLPNSAAEQAVIDSLTINEPAAARLTGLSGKTLTRLSDAGEPTGRIKVGRRVLYLRARLEAWLAARSNAPAAN